MAIALSDSPWVKFPIDDAQELFQLVFPEVDHKMMMKDMFYSSVKSVFISSHLSLTAIPRSIKLQV